MKKLSLKMVALIAAMMMCLTSDAKTEDVGGRVIDMKGEPLPFVSVALLTVDSTYIQGSKSRLPMPAAFCDSRTSVIVPSL